MTISGVKACCSLAVNTLSLNGFCISEDVVELFSDKALLLFSVEFWHEESKTIIPIVKPIKKITFFIVYFILSNFHLRKETYTQRTRDYSNFWCSTCYLPTLLSALLALYILRKVSLLSGNRY